MDTSRIFQEPVQELSGLPVRPKVFWYPSAGRDFRGPVFLTRDHIDKMRMHEGQIFEHPDLFVFNCVGPEVQELRHLLSGAAEVPLFTDDLTSVIGKNYRPLRVLDRASADMAPFGLDEAANRDEFTGEALYFEVEIEGKGYRDVPYREVQKILYFNHENSDLFEKVIRHGPFDVGYLCVTCEGCGFGGNRRSVLDHIYGDREDFFVSDGFRPRFIIGSNNASNVDHLRNALRSGRILQEGNVYSNYNHDNGLGQRDSWILKIGYPV